MKVSAAPPARAQTGNLHPGIAQHTRDAAMELIDMPYLLGGGGMEVEMKLGGNTGTPLWWAARRVCDRTNDCTTTWPQKAGALELATRQGLTLVHFSAQLEPCPTHTKYPTHPKYPLRPP